MPTQPEDVEEILKNLEYRIKGYELINGTWTDTGKAPYLSPNKKGFSKVMSVIRSYVGSHIIFSNLSRKYITESCINLYTDLFINFNKNMAEFGFNSKEDIDIILQIIIDNIMATMLRALNGTEVKLRYQTQTTQYTVSTGTSNTRM